MTISACTEELLSFQFLKRLNIINYFDTINREEFDRTAALFAESGKLLAPFENPIVGRSAIASYLRKEAKGMKLSPNTAKVSDILSDRKQINVLGKVQTSLFAVNVGWYFTVDCNDKILTARIKLLASPQELLGLKKIQDS